jgi:hypothetical protein
MFSFRSESRSLIESVVHSSEKLTHEEWLVVYIYPHCDGLMTKVDAALAHATLPLPTRNEDPPEAGFGSSASSVNVLISYRSSLLLQPHPLYISITQSLQQQLSRYGCSLSSLVLGSFSADFVFITPTLVAGLTMKLCILALAASAVARPYADGGDEYSPASVCHFCHYSTD